MFSARPLLVFFAFACSEPVKIPLQFQPTEVAVVAAKLDGRLTVKVVPHTSEPIEVEADADESVYTWVLQPEHFVGPGGEPLTTETLQKIAPRHESSPVDPSGATGSCDRCMAPTLEPPQIINDGEACRIPQFNRGALWRSTDEGFVCSGASQSKVCSSGPEADQKVIEEVRRAIFLDWPGACACTGEVDAPSLHQLTVRAVSPVASPDPIDAWAQDAEGRIAGFSRYFAILVDPVAGTSSMLDIDEWPVEVRQAIALRDGSGFIVSSEEFNTGYLDAYRFDRFTIAGGRLVGPEPIVSEHLARVDRIKYLGDHPELPLYLVGHVRGNLGSLEPAMFACTDRTLACQQVGLSQCPDERSLARALDVQILPSGIGFALADHAFYLKEPNEPPISNPHPADRWTCSQNESRIWPVRGGGTVKTRGFISLGRAEDRIFVCAHSETAACTPDYAVVLSATVTASASAIVEPQWEAVYRGYDWSRCRDFMRVPGQPDQTRARISGQVLIDFDRTGTVLRETNIGAEYGVVDGLVTIDDLSDGFTVLESNEGQAFLKEGPAELERFYGGDSRALASYLAAVALGEGDFLVLGHPEGLVRVRVLESSDDFPTTDIRVLADPTGALAEGDALRDAVIDSERTAASGMPVVMIAGERAGDTLLLRAVIGDDEVLRGDLIAPPASVADLGAVRIGEATAGQFVVGLEGTRLLRVVGDDATELDIDFDDPDTEEVEARPVLGPDGCSGNTPRLDAWRDVQGKNGVAWVVGSHQLLFRVSGDRVERFYGSPNAEYSAMLLTCSDQAVFAGRGYTVDLAGLEQLAMQFWSIDPIEIDADKEVSLAPRREQALREIASDQVIAIGIGYLTEGYPRAIFPDATAGRGDPEHPPFAAMLHNGYFARFYAAEGLDDARPPFYPEVVVQSPGGYVLYGSWDSRLALGVPTAKR